MQPGPGPPPLAPLRGGPLSPPPPPSPPAGWPPPPYVLPPAQGPYPAKHGAPVGAIAVILVAAAASVLVQQAVWPLLLASPDEGGEAHASVELQAGTWDASSLTFAVASTNSRVLRVVDLSFEVITDNGVPFFGGSSGITETANGVQTTVTYRDANSDGWLGAGDRVRMRVEPATSVAGFHGGAFRLMLGTAILSTVTIP